MQVFNSLLQLAPVGKHGHFDTPLPFFVYVVCKWPLERWCVSYKRRPHKKIVVKDASLNSDIY